MKIPPLKYECEVTEKRETYGLSLKLVEIDKVKYQIDRTRIYYNSMVRFRIPQFNK